MIVFHHNDADGRCAAAIVRKWAFATIPDQIDPIIPSHEGRLLFIEMGYGKPCPLDKILPTETVVIVDYAFTPDVMSQIVDRAARVVWCDHHATAKAYGYDVSGFCDFSDKGLSGCECTWRYFFPDRNIPDTVQLLGDYDAWRLQQQPVCFEYYEGLKLFSTSPESVTWFRLLDDDKPMAHKFMSEIIMLGAAAIKYRDNYCHDIQQSYGYETEIDGIKAYAMNIYRFGSQGFGKLFKLYSVCISYIHDGEKFVVSLYSDGIVDVSAIAKKHGGGGHKGAAGFVCSTLPWTKANVSQKVL